MREKGDMESGNWPKTASKRHRSGGTARALAARGAGQWRSGGRRSSAARPRLPLGLCVGTPGGTLTWPLNETWRCRCSLSVASSHPRFLWCELASPIYHHHCACLFVCSNFSNTQIHFFFIFFIFFKKRKKSTCVLCFSWKFRFYFFLVCMMLISMYSQK